MVASNVTRPPLSELLRRIAGGLDGPNLFRGNPSQWAEPFGVDYERAWVECPRGDYLIWFATRVGVARELVGRAACGCVRFALLKAPEAERVSIGALSTLEQYLAGSAPHEEVREAYRTVKEASEASFSRLDSVTGTAFAAAENACSEVAALPDTYPNHHAPCAYAMAVYAATSVHTYAVRDATAGDWFPRNAAAVAARAEALLRCADILREGIPLPMVMSAVESLLSKPG